MQCVAAQEQQRPATGQATESTQQTLERGLCGWKMRAVAPTVCLPTVTRWALWGRAYILKAEHGIRGKVEVYSVAGTRAHAHAGATRGLQMQGRHGSAPSHLPTHHRVCMVHRKALMEQLLRSFLHPGGEVGGQVKAAGRAHPDQPNQQSVHSVAGHVLEEPDRL